MLRGGRGLTAGVAAAVAAVVLLASYVGLAWWSESGHALPPAGYLAVLPPLLVAAMVLAGAWSVRRTVRGARPSGPHDGLRGYRVLVLCQAAALTGAVLVGWYAALAVVGRAQLALAGLGSPAAAALATTVAGVLLVAAGLVGQSWCRLDDDPPELDQPS
ncbi:DUF3180 domain-containing protein [Arsenicicoccus sp. oral taxon 190]|uniref:DUF3180 domain-containing protein n=1 Tax=Arsenicicoccus sp. oral taxon 190 TaxID=1658671 RepID=UPI00067BB20D|nr:DUF3180 domain-containing protein [Arsenicicoccus sp. oral taxon 190]